MVVAALHMGIRSQLRPLLLTPLLFLSAAVPHSAYAQQGGGWDPVSETPLQTAQIVENLVTRNLERAHALHGYVGTRKYQVRYRGFLGGRTAELVVDMKYESPGTKEFTIRSATGSPVIVDEVLKKLLQAEIEASSLEAQKRTALNDDNYSFTQVGIEQTPTGSMYVLTVDPKRKDKFLYRGQIWVDAKDFAVVRLDAQPAKNPSIWTKKSEVEQVYTRVSGFWLPARNHTTSEIRLGGIAELTIDYSGYRILSPEHVNNVSAVQSAQTAGSASERR